MPKRSSTEAADEGGSARSFVISVPVRVGFSAAMLLLIVIHGVYPAFAVDAVTIALVVLFAVPWILPILESLEFAGVKIRLTAQPEPVRRAKAAVEAAEAQGAVERGEALDFAAIVSATDVLDVEDEALAALNEALVPGWSVLTHRRILLPDGGYEDVDGLIRGPRGWRDVIVEVKLFLRSKTAGIATSQIDRFNARVASLTARTQRSYQPLLLWASRAPSELSPALARAITDRVAGTGLYVGIYWSGRREMSFVGTRPFFVDETKARVVGSHPNL